jgi:hypothetical protein
MPILYFHKEKGVSYQLYSVNRINIFIGGIALERKSNIVNLSVQDQEKYYPKKGALKI